MTNTIVCHRPALLLMEPPLGHCHEVLQDVNKTLYWMSFTQCLHALSQNGSGQKFTRDENKNRHIHHIQHNHRNLTRQKQEPAQSMRVAQRTLAGCGGPKVGVSTPGFGDPRVGVSTPGFGDQRVGVPTSRFGDPRVGVSPSGFTQL